MVAEQHYQDRGIIKVVELGGIDTYVNAVDMKMAIVGLCYMLHEAIIKLHRTTGAQYLYIDNIKHALQQAQSKGFINESKGILDHNSIQGLMTISGEKQKLRQWHQMFRIAMSQINETYGYMIKFMETSMDVGEKIKDVMDDGTIQYPREADEVSAAIYAVVLDKAEGEAYEKHNIN